MSEQPDHCAPAGDSANLGSVLPGGGGPARETRSRCFLLWGPFSSGGWTKGLDGPATSELPQVILTVTQGRKLALQLGTREKSPHLGSLLGESLLGRKAFSGRRGWKVPHWLLAPSYAWGGVNRAAGAANRAEPSRRALLTHSLPAPARRGHTAGASMPTQGTCLLSQRRPTTLLTHMCLGRLL